MVIFNYLKAEKFDVVCLQEAHINRDDATVWEKQWGGKLFYQEGTNNSRGEVVMFSKHFKGIVELVRNYERMLILSVKSDIFNFHIVNVYAPNGKQDKIRFFNKLQESLQEFSEEKLIVLGDYNSVINNDLDIISGNPHDKVEVECFRDTVSGLGLYDAWRIFHPEEKDFTWLKHNPMIARRLDYCFVNEDALPWLVFCEHSIVASTDHKAVVIELNDTEFTRGPGYWHFNNSFLTDTFFVQEFNSYLDSLLEKDNYNDLPSTEKWECIKMDIREFCIDYGKDKARKRKQDTLISEKELKLIEKEMINNPTDTEISQKHLSIKQKYELLKVHHAKGAQIRSRVKWIEEGEKNTKYFCNLERTRAKNNIITRLEDQQGNIITEQNLILQKQVQHFSSIYNQTTEEENIHTATDNFLKNEDFPRLNKEESDSCEGAITLQESSYALSQMKNGSSPGCDGLTVECMKFFWGKLGNLVTNSFLDAFNRGELSYTQKRGVIVLLHKGKELQRDKLNNWRPITLTNTDYKILAKVLALRMSIVIQKVINEDQVGYLKGRNIATVLRTIDDVINYLNVTGKAGYLLAIDYAKAFDSISRDFLLQTFDVFGFGRDFKKWVKVLTGGSSSCINYGGWLSESFEVKCGIRQGCPFSPLAFVLAVELLAVKIRNSSIKGVFVPTLVQGNYKLKIKQLADDMTLFLQDRQDMLQAQHIIQHFGRFSGLKLNVDKTKVMALGTQKTEHNLPFSTTNKMKILGIYFNNTAMAKNIQENWVHRLEKLNNLIKMWSMRDLSIHGKSVVIKTFMISQFTFVMQSVGLPEAVLQKINRLLYKFIWQRRFSNRKAFEKIKRKVMQNDYDKGGLRMVDMNEIQTLYYLQWAGKVASSDKENWTFIPQWHLSQLASRNKVFEFNCRSKKAKNLHSIQNDFWKKVVMDFLDNNTLVEIAETEDTTILNHMIFNNKCILYKGNTLYFKNWKQKGIEQIKDIVHLNEKRLLTIEEIKILIGNNLASIYFEYNALINAIPLSWKEKILILDTTETVNVATKDIESFNAKPKFIKKFLQSKVNNEERSTPRACDFWRQKHNIEVDKSVWLMSRNATKEVRLLELQWKIIHNIYPTNILLQKMKISDTKNCPYCRDTVDYIEHFFYECDYVKTLWNYIENMFMVVLQKKIVLTLQMVMCGIRERSISCSEQNYVNRTILIGKMCISIAKKTKSTMSLHCLLDYHMRLRGITQLSN